MATPDRYIMIDDFRPGIWADTHAGDTSTESTKGALPANGRARISGTKRCRADKTGALIPLPRRNAGLGFYQPTVTHPSSRSGLFLLDAEVGTPLYPYDIPSTFSQTALDRTPIYVAYGYQAQGAVTGRFPTYILGTEIRPWETSSALRYWNFALLRAQPFGGSDPQDADAPLVPIPPASLVKSRFYYGNTVWGRRIAENDFSFQLDWWFPAVVFVGGAPRPEWSDTFAQGALTTAEQNMLNSNTVTQTYTERYVDCTAGGDNYLSIPGVGSATTYPIPNLPHDDSYWDFWLFADFSLESAGSPGTQVIACETGTAGSLGWRLILVNGAIHFELSPDGNTWTRYSEDSNGQAYLPASGFSNNGRARVGLGIVQRYTDHETIQDGYRVVLYRGLANANRDQYMDIAGITNPGEAVWEADGSNLAISTGNQVLRVGSDGAGNTFKGRIFSLCVSKRFPNTPHLREGFYSRLGETGANIGQFSFGRRGSEHGLDRLDRGFNQETLTANAGSAFSMGLGGITMAVTGTLTEGSVAGSTTTAKPFTYYTPGLGALAAANDFGFAAENPTVAVGAAIGMNVNNTWFGDLPVPRRGKQEWAWHTNDERLISRYSPLVERRLVPAAPYLAISHQGRLVFADRRTAQTTRGTATTSQAPRQGELRTEDDIVWYSDYGLPLQDMLTDPPTRYGFTWRRLTHGGRYPTLGHRSYTPLSVMEDVIADIGALGTVTTDQLLIVKSHGGGALVSGDLDNPTIRRLPYVESTFGVILKPVGTPLGLVYGSKNGIFAWAGGEVSTKLSPQLDGHFFDHTQNSSEHYAGAAGRLGFWNQLLCVPNNWVYDMDTQSWWRLESPDERPYNVYVVNNNGELLAFPYKRAANQPTDPVWYSYNLTDLDTEYTWQSHPLVETRERVTVFQEIRLIATGHSAAQATIDVTLEGFDETGTSTTSETVQFVLEASDEPQFLYRDVPTFQGQYVTVRIEAASNDAATPAPKVHSVALGVKDRARTVRHG